MITKDKLKHILTDTESYHVERTISTDNADKFCQAICAFSSDIDSARISQYEFRKRLENFIKNTKHNKLIKGFS